MSGHNKWSTIKHKKGAADAKRGKLFSKLIKEITIAARLGGGDPSGNPRLRTVLDKARAANMPKDNVERAIKKGTGELEGVNIEEITFEGYGPSGVAVMVETLTDNRNRTVAELRHIFEKSGGNLGAAGCVGWMFSKHGVLTFEKDVGEEALMETALEAGAEDISEEEGIFTVTTPPTAFEAVKQACEAKGLNYVEADLSMVPQNTVKLDHAAATKMLKLMDTLDEHDDVQNVYANFDIDAKTMEEVAAQS